MNYLFYQEEKGYFLTKKYYKFPDITFIKEVSQEELEQIKPFLSKEKRKVKKVKKYGQRNIK